LPNWRPNEGRSPYPSGVETGYVLEGEFVLSIDGQPDRTLKAGESYQIPAGAVHDAAVHGDKPMKVLGFT
jgi:quercetin dioxygenase-like cupin family protein